MLEPQKLKALGTSGKLSDSGEPCGVPASVADTIPPSNTPARSQPPSSLSIRRSHTRRPIWASNAS
jgi:hypothetical protein